MTTLLLIFALITFLCVTIYRYTDHNPGDIITLRRHIIHEAAFCIAIISLALFIFTAILFITA